MNRSPSITLAIPTYNRAALLRQTLTGLVRQDLPREAFEILVIDNNSSDETASVVAEFSSARPAPRRILETRQGLDHARNRAVAEARGEILVLGDDDILVEPEWLRRITAPFADDTEGKIGAVGGEVTPVFPEGLPPWVAEWHSPLAFRREAGPLDDRQNPMGAALAFRTRVFAAHGLFSTELDRTGGKLFSGGETEMLRRLRAAGWEIWFAPEAVALHQMPASRTTFCYAARHAFDSARSRVVDRAQQSRDRGQGLPAAYLFGRFVVNGLKALGLLLGALLAGLILRIGTAKKCLVRAWRCCGYLYQIPRSCVGKI